MVLTTVFYAATNNRTFIHNQYAYDELSNVISIANNGATVAMPTANQIGGKSYQSYEYDDLNRLTGASGQTSGNNETGTGVIHNKYTLGMTYDNQHNIVGKTQTHFTATGASPTAASYTNTQTEQTNYNLDYGGYNTANYTVAGYNYNQPHAPRLIIDQPVALGSTTAANDPRIKTKGYEYDYNGNQTRTLQTVCNAPGETLVPELLRENLWDEENRLRAIDLNPSSPLGGGGGLHPIAIYTYDAGGERIIKHNATSVALYENAKKVGETTKSDFMLYPSGMLVARPAADGTGGMSYTKHYFAGSQRVSSKIGTTTNLGTFLQDWTLQENASGGAAINLVGTSHAQLTKAEAGVNHVYTQFNMPTQTFASNTAFLPVPAFLTPPSGAGGLGTEMEQYYFHPDHLGSSNYITNIAGEVSQHTEYFAFGETFVEEHKGSNNSPYKFNGKELDEESGLYYYGARYYDPRISIWASVDPLAEKTMSSYGYCYNNPINLIDPDGRQPGPFKLGKPKSPKFTYDDGFLGVFSPRKAGFGDYASYAGWGIKTFAATLIRWDLGNALSAYRHFRGASGSNFKFDLPDYYDDDDSGKTMLKSCISIAKTNANEMLKSSGKIQMTSDGFSVGGGDARFPYPDTEDWQKAVGAFNFWMSADVTAIEKKGIISYTMKLTIHAEDKYNFNPGMQDIATGTPDDANGKFETTGLGKQFMQNGTSNHTINWKVKAPKPVAPKKTP